MTETIDLSTFKRDKTFYPETKLLITIKSFDLQAIRQRYLKTKNKKSNRAGSVERRSVTEGGLASLVIKKGEIKIQEVLLHLPEPRGIDIQDGVLAISSENKVYIFHDNQITEIENDWFSYIHTVSLKKDHVLISSSGFDAIFEYNFKTKKQTFEWFAWENGFDHGLNAEGEKVYLTRDHNKAEELKLKGLKYLYITNPKEQALPTSQRAAFINSVIYDPYDKNKIIATFFHEGCVYSIDMQNGNYKKVLDSLKNPHGGRKLKNDYRATSTTSGEVVLGDLKNNKRYQFQQIEGKPEELSGFEWIQNSVMIDHFIISIDSNNLRVAFSSINLDDVEPLFDSVYDGMNDLLK